MAAIWLTPAGNLGVIPALEYYQFKLDAYNPEGGDVAFSLVAGSLPIGLHIDETGNVQGVPINANEALLEGVPSAVSKVTTSTFTVRITNQASKVTDRTFTLSVAGIIPPVITPKNIELGDFFDGDLVYLQLYAVEQNPGLTVTWDLINGDLPPGVSIDETGLITGYIEPAIDITGVPGWEESGWELNPWDFNGKNVSRNYKFTVTAFDGVNFDSSTFTIYVYAKANMTADNDILTGDNDSVVTTDTDNIHRPVILTLETEFPTVRQNERHALQIQAKDFDNDDISWQIDSGSLPPGMSLNTNNGWITGFIPSGALANNTYTFTVSVYKRDYPTYISNPITYTVVVQGQVDSTVTWNTATDLGIIDNGSISDFVISASVPSNRALFYKLYDGTELINPNNKLPQGLRLLSDGNISGRVAFETFKIDGGTTTFDGIATTFDKIYSFFVEVYDIDGFVSDVKKFTITVNEENLIPYENLYIQVLPSKVHRDTYHSIINDSDIFPLEDIYKINDPWFGKNNLLRSLFLTGLEPSSLSDYISAMTNNHYWKKINFGNLKTARALDSNFNIKYEVVYIELNDNSVNEEYQSPPANITLPTNSASISTVCPNSFTNMVKQFTDQIGYSNKSILPDWMTSRQEDGRVLGFTRALVLCYSKPGKSKSIAYRVKSKLSDLQKIDFTVDRYELDSALSGYYNLDNGSFVNYFDATGNITVLSNSSVVSGNNTVFLSELSVGQTLVINNNELGRIQEIASNTSLTLFANSTITANNVSFSHTIGETTFDRSTDATTFDNNQTRFYGSRITYTTPGEGDKYLKFPQIGVLA